MKYVFYTDEKDLIHRVLLPTVALDEEAAEKGIPADIPCLDTIDWQEVQKELHNLLTKREIYTKEDLSRVPGGITSVILAVLRPRLKRLYS